MQLINDINLCSLLLIERSISHLKPVFHWRNIVLSGFSLRWACAIEKCGKQVLLLLPSNLINYNVYEVQEFFAVGKLNLIPTFLPQHLTGSLCTKYFVQCKIALQAETGQNVVSYSLFFLQESQSGGRMSPTRVQNDV